MDMQEKFDPIATLAVYVINLDRSDDRLKRISDQLSAMGLGFTRIPAVDGATLDLNDQTLRNCVNFDFWRKFHHRDLIASEIGCYLSHVKALNHFLECDQDFALILEDDAHLGPDCYAALAGLVRLSARWDIVKLIASHPGPQIRRAKITEQYNLTSYVVRTARATAYLVNRKAAAKLATELLPMRLPYDHIFDRNFENRLRVRGVNPMPVSTGHMDSTINEIRKPHRGLLSKWGDPPLLERWRVPFYRTWIETRRMFYNLFTDGGLAAMFKSDK